MRISNLAASMKAEGKDIVSLSAGEPDFPTPENVNQAAIAAINAGFTRYTANSGIPELKAAIIAKFKRDNELEFQPNQIIVSNGGKQTGRQQLMQACGQAGKQARRQAGTQARRQASRQA